MGEATGAERARLEEAARGGKKWRRFGTYLSERQWGTVREDYSASGDAWAYFPFEHARLRAYRWGEDGLLGLTDNRGLLCFAPALWNGRDPILKERLFGLSNPEGNHGEDVKEAYYYLDNTPSHAYARALYKYPQAEFPYELLRRESARRGRARPEFDLHDSGVFDHGRYFDVEITYAKADWSDLLVDLHISNRGPDPAELWVLPTFWLRNTWSWGEGEARHRFREADAAPAGARALALEHPHFGRLYVYFEAPDELLFTDNDTNYEALYGRPNLTPHVKDAFHRYVVGGERGAVNPERVGSKAAALKRLRLGPGAHAVVRARLSDRPLDDPFGDFTGVVRQRRAEADEFYASIMPPGLGEDEARVYRQALGGLLWTKQYYHFDVTRWLRGDPGQPPPPPERLEGRNASWGHVYNSEIIVMPDKWEYPWYAAWDTAFHAVSLALADPDLAKEQLSLLLREWFMHPNGQIPAYEWAFGDVNPPVHAWAALRVYELEKKKTGAADRAFLESVFHKLMLNFTWWVNRKDSAGKNVFEGGFLGLDNIGVFDRSAELPGGGRIEQADATSWMGMYCLNLLEMALELARYNRAYEDVASKFFEHFLHIAHAMHGGSGRGESLWDEHDGFYYDVLSFGRERLPVKIRSMVGLIPLFAAFVLEGEAAERAGGFFRRMRWFLTNRPELAAYAKGLEQPGQRERRLLSLVDRRRLPRLLGRLFDETEFLSPYGVRGLSRRHAGAPYVLWLGGREHRVDYEPGESQTGLFGGNSNWRGPVWFPVNYLLLASLRTFGRYFGDSLRLEVPSGSGRLMNLAQAADELGRRLVALFLRDRDGRRPALGDVALFQHDPHFRDHILFYEYFHGESGQGLGAAHQTGWTALVANLLDECRRGA
ncbi:MAG TPA: glucosidase [Polyangiaceae bacterium]|nr:glucosidase [Polyangiaceae bacterium]